MLLGTRMVCNLLLGNIFTTTQNVFTNRWICFLNIWCSNEHYCQIHISLKITNKAVVLWCAFHVVFFCYSADHTAQRKQSIGVGKLAGLAVVIGKVFPHPVRCREPADRQGHVHTGAEGERRRTDAGTVDWRRQVGSGRTSHDGGVAGRAQLFQASAHHPVDIVCGRRPVEVRQRVLFKRVGWVFYLGLALKLLKLTAVTVTVRYHNCYSEFLIINYVWCSTSFIRYVYIYIAFLSNGKKYIYYFHTV